MTPRPWCVLALALVAGTSVNAQAIDTLVREGARVRVWHPAYRWTGKEGLIVARSTDTLTVRVSEKTSRGSPAGLASVPLRLQEIDSMRVAVAERRRVKPVAWILTGSAVGALATVWCREPHSDYVSMTPRCKEQRILIPILGAIAGAGAAAIAKSLPVNRWRSVALPR